MEPQSLESLKVALSQKPLTILNHLNHHWPKIPANLNSCFYAKGKIQIGWNPRPVVVQVIEIVKGFWDKAAFKTNLLYGKIALELMYQNSYSDFNLSSHSLKLFKNIAKLEGQLKSERY